jgi:hypothetical protein
MKLDYNQTTNRPRTLFGKKFTPIPAGSYFLFVLDIESRTPKNGGSDYLAVTFEVERGEHLGRRLWDNFFINHENELARNISRDRFDDLARACGVFPITDTDPLLTCVCRAKVDIEEKEGFEPRNRVKSYVTAKGKEAPAKAGAASVKRDDSLPDSVANDEIPF